MIVVIDSGIAIVHLQRKRFSRSGNMPYDARGWVGMVWELWVILRKGGRYRPIYHGTHTKCLPGNDFAPPQKLRIFTRRPLCVSRSTREFFICPLVG